MRSPARCVAAEQARHYNGVGRGGEGAGPDCCGERVGGAWTTLAAASARCLKGGSGGDRILADAPAPQSQDEFARGAHASFHQLATESRDDSC
jgi:hypothetical protein